MFIYVTIAIAVAHHKKTTISLTFLGFHLGSNLDYCWLIFLLKGKSNAYNMHPVFVE